MAVSSSTQSERLSGSTCSQSAFKISELTLDFLTFLHWAGTRSRARAGVMTESCQPTRYTDTDIFVKVKWSRFGRADKTRCERREHVQVTEARTRLRLSGLPRRVHLKLLRPALRMKAEKVTAARQLLVSPVDRAWPQGLADALVLELAQNPTHDWLFSHKANSQTRGLSTTLLAIVGPPRVRRVHFCPPPQVCHPHSESTAPNALIHVHYVRASRAERLAKNFSH